MNDRRATLSKLAGSDALAMAVFVTVLLWGLFLCLEVAHGLFGIAGAVLGAVFFPVLLMTAPWHALFALGHPLPAILCYGGAILGWALVAFGGRGMRRSLRGW